MCRPMQSYKLLWRMLRNHLEKVVQVLWLLRLLAKYLPHRPKPQPLWREQGEKLLHLGWRKKNMEIRKMRKMRMRKMRMRKEMNRKNLKLLWLRLQKTTDLGGFVNANRLERFAFPRKFMTNGPRVGRNALLWGITWRIAAGTRIGFLFLDMLLI